MAVGKASEAFEVPFNSTILTETSLQEAFEEYRQKKKVCRGSPANNTCGCELWY